ncbi:unnamed protein product [Albugo candida]|nr:unnamed protein product [Albugo candida]|eukprot:CCI45100.1 unnamed protein product [Albugo candida]
MMINPSRQMGKHGRVQNRKHEQEILSTKNFQNLCNYVITWYKERSEQIELEYDLRTSDDPEYIKKKTKSLPENQQPQCEAILQKPILSSIYQSAAIKAHTWIEENLDKEGVTKENKWECITVLLLVLDSRDPVLHPPSTPASSSASSSTVKSELGENGIVVNWLYSRDLYTRQNYAKLQRNISLRGQAQLTTPQPSERTVIGLINDEKDTFKNWLINHCIQTYGPSATASKVTTPAT